MNATNHVLPPTIQDALERRALFIVNHSGGKDSQAMLIRIRRIASAERIVVIHAHLPGVEWAGTEEHVRATSAGLDVFVTRAKKSFFNMVESRGMFPSPRYRQCTSDLKRGPIDKIIREIASARAESLIVNCMGLRAEESAARAGKSVVKANARLSKSGRTVIDWLPIHLLTERDVFAEIALAGQRPHWAYAAGMTRLSCCFCIMASRADLKTAARLNPELYRRYVETEKRLGFTLSPTLRPLEEITGIAASEPLTKAA